MNTVAPKIGIRLMDPKKLRFSCKQLENFLLYIVITYRGSDPNNISWG
jgi:hypothetical protein